MEARGEYLDTEYAGVLSVAPQTVSESEYGMKMTIESTDRIVFVDGVPARIWQGTSEGGVDVACAITAIAIPDTADSRQFDAELQQCVPPGLDAQRAFPQAMSSFVCPRCGVRSFNLKDAAEGYCGACHEFTGGRPS